MPREAYVFAQFLRLLPRYEFQRIVEKYHGDYRTKHFKCWQQLACNLFEQKPLISIFQSNARAPREQYDNQLKLFDL